MDRQKDKGGAIFTETIYSGKILTIINRTLDMMDGRLLNHGVRVGLVLRDMLNTEGCQNAELRKNLGILALLHDVGAYRTEEIKNLVRFETGDVWGHSIYGYLFFREFTPLKELAKVILYHHADVSTPYQEPEEILHYAQMLHAADRAVIWHDEVKGTKTSLWEHFARKSGTTFSPECIRLLRQADQQQGTLSRLDAPIALEDVIDCGALRPEEADAYLTMVVHTIDFRSRVTVTHTMGVREIGMRLAEKMGLPREAVEQIGYGALLHDLGKIGIPLSILEKQGRLTGEEMAVMREHVPLTAQIIDGCVDETVARIALRHHEKLNGSGYPQKLSGGSLSLSERILAVADIASALGMRRSYKEPFPKERCMGILREMADRGEIDPGVVDTLANFYDEIIGQADLACEPVREAYDRLTEEYPALLRAYSRAPTEDARPNQKEGKT